MARTTVDIDLSALDAARSALHTTGVSATINAALRDAARRAQLASFDVLELPDLPSPAQVEEARRERDFERSTRPSSMGTFSRATWSCSSSRAQPRMRIRLPF